jgi:multidrug efflux system membrane fusion protein
MNRSMLKNSFIGSILILIPASLCLSCSGAKGAPPARVVPVVIAQADQKSVPLQIKAIGNIEAYNTVSIKALVGGAIQGVYFQEGQEVKKNDLLFKIDEAPYAAALRQAEANLAKDAAQAKNAEEQAKRYATLVEKEYVSKDQYDQLRANADASAAAADADRAAVENAKLQLSYCTIKSPISGRAGSILVNDGNVIKANDLTLTTINQIEPIYATFSVPEQNLSEIKRHNAAGELSIDVILPNEEKRAVRGKLTFIDNTVDKTTGTIKLKGTFDNADRRLWPGQFVDVVLQLTVEPNRVLVPTQAVQTGQQGQYVYVVKDDSTAELRVIEQGRIFDNNTIVNKGVKAGEKVVIDGQVRLVPGVKVEIKNEGAKSQAPERK